MTPTEKGKSKLTRRQFVTAAAGGAAALAGTTALGGYAPVAAQAPAGATALPETWDYEADLVVIGSGSTGMPAAVKARALGASVIVVEANFDVGGRAITAGNAVPLGGGTKCQIENGVEDSPDLHFRDMTDWTILTQNGLPEYRYNNFELMRAACDAQVEIFDFLEEHGVIFAYETLTTLAGRGGGWGSSVPRNQSAVHAEDAPADDPHYAPGEASALIRPLERTARDMGVQFMLNRHADKLIREEQFSGRVVGITASYTPRIPPGSDARLESYWSDGNIDETRETVTIKANKGVIIATSGANGNVAIRKMYNPRLTEEVQVSVGPWLGWDRAQDGAMIVAALDHGAALSSVTQTLEHGGMFRKRNIIGVRDVYKSWGEDSPVFPFAVGVGLSVGNGAYHDAIVVNQVGKRFFDETGDGYAYPRSGPTLIGTITQEPYEPGDWRNIQAVEKNFATFSYTDATRAMNEGSSFPEYAAGPVWMIFDQAMVDREEWDVNPPTIDPAYFFSADTLAELAAKIIQNPFSKVEMPPENLEATMARYNLMVEVGQDVDFGKSDLEYKIDTPPFYAAWCTPVLHDFYGGLNVNADCQVMDRWGNAIPGLYAGGEAAGGWSEHGHGKCITGGYLAAKHAVEKG